MPVIDNKDIPVFASVKKEPAPEIEEPQEQTEVVDD